MISKYDARKLEFNRIHVSSHSKPLTKWEYLGSRYRKYSSIFSESVGSNPIFQNLSRRFGHEPGELALGVAEGLILYKTTFLIHAPLELYLIVKLFQVRNCLG